MAQVLRQLPKPTHPDLLVGSELFDDAGVFRLSDDLALVQTVDFFPPLVDDPFIFGQVAAANSLSDVYAMGATPVTALNIAAFPDKDLPQEVFVEILRGGADRVEAAGAVIAGGHSVRDSEVKYGLAVTGTIDPRRIITNAGARSGDRLVLTKPVGSGVLTSAAKLGKMPESDLAETIATMIQLNRGAADAMRSVDTHAATDITGFGLIGHAFEMAAAGGVTISIEASAVPLLGQARRFAEQGVLTRAHKSTLAHVGDSLDAVGVDEVLVNILADAQTSGGLLIAVAPEDADALVAALLKHNTPCAAVIGSVEPDSGPSIRLR